MLDIAGSNRQMTFPALPDLCITIASTPLVQQYLQQESDCHSHSSSREKLAPTLPSLPYRQNDGSPAANGSNSFHSPPLSCWLASGLVKRMLVFERTDLCRTPEAGSLNPKGSVEHRLRTPEYGSYGQTFSLKYRISVF